ncbi:Zn-dependent exopeptidase [Panus rudis PR-1116 ss-1]|nr:Zn-dependent exopeptidase [Panus rudis PR-1116 ss-1]
MPAPKEFLDYIDAHAKDFISGRLTDAVAIKSVSGDPSLRDEVKKMGDWLSDQLTKCGVETRKVNLGQQIIDGQTIDLPPAILGRIGSDLNKKTVLIYGHYDVQPFAPSLSMRKADISDGWRSNPFKLDVNWTNGVMTGRGSTDDKGPIMGWLNVLEAHHESGMPLPVNMRFCFEGMEESDSEGLDDLIAQEAAKGDQGWFDHVNCVCISDNYWLNTRTPCLTYGLRGIAYFTVTVSGPGSDLHSGIFGGTVFEPMTALTLLMSKLVAPDATILIPGVCEGVEPPSCEEIAAYDDLDYTVEDLNAAAGGDIALSDDKAKVLMGRMRNPCLSLHGIQGAFSGDGAKTVIPAKVTGKFSLRLVPPQVPSDIEKKVKDYLYKEFDDLKTKCKVNIEMIASGMPWVADKNSWNYNAAQEATEAVWHKTPDYTREGGSIPVALTFANNLPAGTSVLLLPMGRGDDGAHSINEKLDMDNYITGSKLLGTYLYEVAAAEIPQ